MNSRLMRHVVQSGLAVFLGAGIVLCCKSKTESRGDEPRGWGKGDLKSSEWSYYTARVMRTIKNWQERAKNAPQGEGGVIEEVPPTLLVIDPAKPSIWIERAGKVVEGTNAPFPTGMNVKVIHFRPEGNRDLPGPVRLRARGVHTSRLTPEMLYIAVAGRNSSPVGFQFGVAGIGSDIGGGRPLPTPFAAPEKTGKEEYYGSIVLSDEEYARLQERSASLPADEKPDEEHADSPVAAHRAAWLRIEKWLYAEIEARLYEEGFDIRDMTVTPGPDYSAAHAEIQVTRNNAWQGILGRSFYPRVYLKMDYLGDDVWYAKSAVNPQKPYTGRDRVDLELLVHATGAIPKSERAAWLEKGRKVQEAVAASASPSKWTATVPGGATIEFIGVCESPSGGKPWWGPDGSPLAAAPYFNDKTILRPRSDRNVFEIAWKTNLPSGPAGPGGHEVSYSMERAVGSGNMQILDRYGSRLYDLEANGYAFDKSREATTLSLTLRIAGQTAQEVRFKNISLVPGKKPGFAIETGEVPHRAGRN